MTACRQEGIVSRGSTEREEEQKKEEEKKKQKKGAGDSGGKVEGHCLFAKWSVDALRVHAGFCDLDGDGKPGVLLSSTSILAESLAHPMYRRML